MQSCEELQNLQADLEELIKINQVPVEKLYKLAPGTEIRITIKQIEETDQFQIEVESSTGLVEAQLDGHRKIPALLVGLTSQKVIEYLENKQIDPCTSMIHAGADEILTLYKCVKEFRASPVIPFSSWVRTKSREYEIFSIKEESGHWRIEFTTNHIYGESVKTIAEVEYEALIPEQCHGLLERMLGEWFRPESVKSVKVVLADLERSQL